MVTIQDLRNGLVLELLFEEKEGDIAYDTSGNNNNGTIYGAARVDGRVGKALSFDGVDDYVSISSQNRIPTGSSARSVFAWVYVKAYPPENDEEIISYGAKSVNGDSFTLAIDPSGYVNVDIFGDRVTATLQVPLNSWHFVGAVYNGGTSITLYLDEQSYSGSFSITPNTQLGAFAYIGAFSPGYLLFNGIIDDVCIYNRALSGDEVKLLYDIADYEHALRGLKGFRKKVFDTIVSGRVKAVLDVNHETVGKYASIIDSFTVTPYMFDVIRRKALALRFNSTDIGSGKISVLKDKYTGGKAEYPIQSPPAVPIRQLPQVDVFVYTPSTDIEVVEKSSEHLWGNLFVLQATKSQFREVPDAENVFFDFYMLRPVARGKFKASLTYPETGFDTWQTIEGEMVILHTALTPQGSNLTLDYFIFVFVDANITTSTGEVNVVPVVIIVTHSTAGNPEVTLVCGGKRLKSTDEGVFCGWVAEGQFVGFTKTHGGHEPVSYSEVWYGSKKLTIWVNDPSMGYTDPSVGTYTKKTTDLTTVYAHPYSGYTVKAWDLDGYDFPPSDSFTLYHFRDHSLGCIFMRGGFVTIRPTANGDVIENEPYGASQNWDCVNDEYSDGDATFVSPYGFAGMKSDLYQMSDISLPSGAVIDSLTLAMRVRRKRTILLPVTARLKLKTYGTVYNGSLYTIGDEWTLITWKLDKNPYTNQAWTQDEINNLQVGVDLELKVERVTGYSSFVVCTQVYGDVEWHS